MYGGVGGVGGGGPGDTGTVQNKYADTSLFTGPHFAPNVPDNKSHEMIEK